MAPGELVETAKHVCRYPGQRLSWWQAQQACEQRFGHLLLGAPEGILAPWLRDPLWAAQRQASQQRPPLRRECGDRGVVAARGGSPDSHLTTFPAAAPAVDGWAGLTPWGGAMELDPSAAHK